MSLLLGSVCVAAAHNGVEHKGFSRSMSAPGLTSEAQLRYILQWFGEFSELQREDFVPVLAAAKSGKPDHLALALARLTCADKPVSLFQCRIKLFNEWYPTWSEEEQDRLVKRVTEMDTEFGAKLQEELVNGPKMNGDMNGTYEVSASDIENHKDDDENNAEVSPDHPVSELEVVHESIEAAVPQDNMPVEITAAS